MTTFAVLKDRIADDLRRSDLDSQINNAVLDAVKRWEGKRFWFNEKRFRVDTVDGTETYALPSTLLETDGSAITAGEDLLAVDDAVILDNGDTYRLHEQTDQWMNEWQSPAARYKGTPDYYGIYANALRLAPIPDAVYQITLSGIARLVPLSADGDSNAWTTEAESLIRHQALAEIYRVVLRDPEGFRLAQGGIVDALDLLRGKTSPKVSKGRVRAWGYV